MHAFTSKSPITLEKVARFVTSFFFLCEVARGVNFELTINLMGMFLDCGEDQYKKSAYKLHTERLKGP